MPAPPLKATADHYNRISRERIARAARIYSSNNDAGAALGMAPGAFGRACRRYGIETPWARHLRERREAKERRAR